MSTEWEREQARFDAITARACASLPLAQRLDSATSILSLEFDDKNDAAIDLAIAELAIACNGVKGYAKLERSHGVEHTSIAAIEDGPCCRLVRAFQVFPSHGEPRMSTLFHVAVSR